MRFFKKFEPEAKKSHSYKKKSVVEVRYVILIGVMNLVIGGVKNSVLVGVRMAILVELDM